MTLRVVIFVSLLFFSSSTFPESIRLVDGGLFEGNIVEGLIQGEGKITWVNGATYEGGFVDGLFHGQGVMHYSDDSVYRGEFQQGLFHGQGELAYLDGVSFQGSFEAGEFVSGDNILADETVFRGDFENFLLKGSGSYSAPELGTWNGSFEAGVLVGEGSYESLSGDKYLGGFSNWGYHGEGVFISSEGDEYKGEFRDGNYHGEGHFSGSDGQEYEGHFQYGEFHGQGHLTLPSDEEYKGNFEYGSYSGKGKRTLKTGEIQSGIFNWGELGGEGRIEYANGDVYEGALRNGQYHGQGQFFSKKENTTLVGHWKNGQQVSNEVDGQIEYLANAAETALYNQNSLLDENLDAIVSSDPEQINLYFLGIGGDGSQGVFRREIEYARDLMDTRFSTKDRSVILLNSAKTVNQYPMATVTAIQLTLDELAQKMDTEKDILFIYMTSHGSKNHDFYLNQVGIDLPDFPAQYMAQIIGDLPFKNKVIGVSACYSGGFIDPLKDDNTMILTAASSNKTSFGCSDDADFTFFGRALFEQALNNTFSFRNAFHQAYDLVEQWESEQEYDHSRPQLHAPEPILNHLKKWAKALPDYEDEPVAKEVLAKWWLREKSNSLLAN